MSFLVISTRSIGLPFSQAIHWLGTAISGALLESIGIWAAKAIVGSTSADTIDSASSVLVILGVMEASSIGSPGSNTVNRLTATRLDALDLLVLNWASLTVQVSLGGDLVGSAALILVASSNMLAAAI